MRVGGVQRHSVYRPIRTAFRGNGSGQRGPRLEPLQPADQVLSVCRQPHCLGEPMAHRSRQPSCLCSPARDPLLQLLGLGILALGIYAIVLSNEAALQVVGSTTLSVPGIVLVVLGVFLVVVGFCGWLGALREIFILLVVVSPPSPGRACGPCQPVPIWV